jgi:hypothetical protein
LRASPLRSTCTVNLPEFRYQKYPVTSHMCFCACEKYNDSACNAYSLDQDRQVQKKCSYQKSWLQIVVKVSVEIIHLFCRLCLLPSSSRPTVAIRILRSARELGWHTVALYTTAPNLDVSHATYADEVCELPDVALYVNVQAIVEIAIRYAH